MTENAPARTSTAERKQAPAIESPRDGRLVHDKAIGFSWAPVDGAEHYQVQVAADAEFEDVLAAVTTQSTSITLYDTIRVEGMQELHWRVASGPRGSWSEPATFRAADEQVLLTERRRRDERAAVQARVALQEQLVDQERIPLVTPEDSTLSNALVGAILGTIVVSFIVLLVILMIFGQVTYPSEAVLP